MSGKLGDKAAAAAPGNRIKPKDYDAVQLAKLDTATLDASLKAKHPDPASDEYRAGNALNTARDIGYAAALMDVYALRPAVDGFGSAQDALDAWAAAIGDLVPQFPP